MDTDVMCHMYTRKQMKLIKTLYKMVKKGLIIKIMN